LGSDGKNDDKVYVVKEGHYSTSNAGSVILEAGVIELTNSDGSSFSHKMFKELAGTIYAEGTPWLLTHDESAAIYSTLENRAAKGNRTVYQ
jgi:hypothetical protein